MIANQSRYNLTVIGAPGVGKSALTLRFLFSEFVDDYEPTKVDSYHKQVEHDGQTLELQITDTAGQEDYASVRDTFLRSGEGFICVFSLTDLDSFNHIQELHSQVKQAKSMEISQIPFLIVGNKNDLEQHRVVTAEEAEKLAESLGSSYMETSAKTNHNVNEAFQQIIGAIYESRITESQDNEDEKLKKKKKKKKSGGLLRKLLCGVGA